MDLAKAWFNGLSELNKIKSLKIKKDVVIKQFENGFKKHYCANCNEQLYDKDDFCSCCRQFIEWNNEKPMY